MLKEIFVQTYYPTVKEAGLKFKINPVVLLAQIAIETGWGESRLCTEHNNFGGLTGFGKPTEFWPGTKIQLSEKKPDVPQLPRCPQRHIRHGPPATLQLWKCL